MAPDQQSYGVSDLEYDLVTTLSNLLQGQEALDRYARDAEQAGDAEAATAFRTIRENNRDGAQRLRSVLSRRLSQGA